jgi:hypothetical protein
LAARRQKTPDDVLLSDRTPRITSAREWIATIRLLEVAEHRAGRAATVLTASSA